MNRHASDEMNQFLVSVFNQILRREEMILKDGPFHDLSVKEMHVIDRIAECQSTGYNTASEIAKLQGITAGTLTVSIHTLERKGYVLRCPDPRDGRIVRIELTEKGKSAYAAHFSFHQSMVDCILKNLSEEETGIFIKGLSEIAAFFGSQKDST